LATVTTTVSIEVSSDGSVAFSSALWVPPRVYSCVGLGSVHSLPSSNVGDPEDRDQRDDGAQQG
jgi:hypothetical protein